MGGKIGQMHHNGGRIKYTTLDTTTYREYHIYEVGQK